VGEVSTPVLTQFGYHIIRVDDRKGDTLSLRHILVRIEPSDSSARATDRKADQLSKLAASGDQPKKLDTAAKALSLKIDRIVATEDEPAALNGVPIPSVSAWAFGGARPGETSELFDDDKGYYLARLDTLSEGGEPRLASVKEDVRSRVAMQRKLDQLLPNAERLSSAAAASSLEAAAAQQGLKVEQSPMFTRSSFVPGLGQFNEAVGASFALPTAAVSAPIKTADAVFVLRVDKRVSADSAAWLAQKELQRQQRLSQVRQQKIQLFLDDLRKSAKLEDRRKQINASVRRTAA
jgi:peptidyl-prolyl cis-trans isomerase D